MKVYQMVQTSPDWWSIRRGKPTCSSLHKIIRASDGKLSKSRNKYIAELLAEAAMPDAAYFSTRGVWRGTQAMQDGKDSEGAARAWYAMETNLDVQQVGFLESDCGCWGGSPDGVLGLKQMSKGQATIEGGVEIKCCQLDTQFHVLLQGKLPLEYKTQIHGHLALSGAQFWDFVSYHPNARGFIIRVYPDSFTEQVQAAVEEFVGELTREAQRLGVMLGAAPVEPEPAF